MASPASRVGVGLVGGVCGLAALVAVTVRATLPSDSDLAKFGAVVRLPTLAPDILNQVNAWVRPSSAVALQAVFAELDYDLEGVRAGDGVPRIYVTNLPPDLSEVNEVAQRKTLFIRTVLPLILIANQEIETTRERLVALRDRQAKKTPPSSRDVAWLARVRERYGVDADADYDTLLAHVDVIPASLALSQSIEESGWGTSRFARGGNALFGQRTWSDQSEGIVPEGRAQDESHRVRAYMNLMGGVRAYMLNLNRHPAYESLRQTRAAQRAEGAAIDGWALIAGLERYSERGPDYVEQIRGLMKTNGLRDFDQTSLRSWVGAESRLSQAIP